jgi:glycosyltransferase involved in cell wall biosynthesis
MIRPLVSVIMPVYNADAFVGASLESILSQTYTNLQVVVVNDGSTDNTQAVLDRFSDRRLQVVHQANSGVSAALNKALSLAKGSLIARQDADDISAPDRIAKQVAHFQANTATVILGTWGLFFSPDDGPDAFLERPTSDAAIRFALLFDSPFVSTSVMIRAEVLERVGGFDESRTVWDDYDMWSRLVLAGKAANLPERLVQYRVVGTGLTQTSSNAHAWVMEQRRRILGQLMPDLPRDLLAIACRIGVDHPKISVKQLRSLQGHYERFIDRTTCDAGERTALRSQLLDKLRSCRIISHHSLAHRLLDKLARSLLLR